MADITTDQVLELENLDPDAWNDYAMTQGWGDGFPLVMPTETKVAAFVETAPGDNEPFLPMSPRRVVPTFESIAANAVMAGCKPKFFPTILAQLSTIL